MCPCSQTIGSLTVALLVTAALVLAVGVLRVHWLTMKASSRVTSVVVIALVACLGLAFGLRGSWKVLCRLPASSERVSTAPAIESPAASASASMSNSRPAGTAPAEELPFKVVAFYFHRTLRCHTCLTIEELSKKTIENGYAGELASGLVEWRPINTEEKGNEHFEKDYGLTAQSLVLVRRENGHQVSWKNLAAVWELVGDPFAFDKYVRTELRTALYGDAAAE